MWLEAGESICWQIFEEKYKWRKQQLEEKATSRCAQVRTEFAGGDVPDTNMDCCGNDRAMCGCLVFALLYSLSGVTMATTGILAMVRLPVVFRTGSVIWAGIMITGMGFLTVAIVLCKKSHDIRKTIALLLVSVAVLVICFLNLVLFEIIEWREIFGSRLEPVNPQQTDLTAIFYVHLSSLLSTVVGLVSSLVGSIYVCCVLTTSCNRGQSKNMDQSFGDPEMCKHKYLTTSPPNFGDPSPLSQSGKPRVQHGGRLSSWTFEGPVSVTYRPNTCETSAVLSDVTEEPDRTVCEADGASSISEFPRTDGAACQSNRLAPISKYLITSGGLEPITECTAESSAVIGMAPPRFQDPTTREEDKSGDASTKSSALHIISTRL